MSKTRLLFYSDDFKTENWSRELEKLGCEVVRNSTKRFKYFHNTLFHARVILNHFVQGKKIDVFVFRYLNDSQHLRVSLEYLARDFINVILCKLLRVKLIWLMHNIDKETIVRFPLISKIRRKIVSGGCDRILATDPHLIEFAVEYGIDREKLDWICFGPPEKLIPDKQNQLLKKKIENFKKSFYKKGIKNVTVGLCVSEPAKKKAHYLYADSITGAFKNDETTCVILVMIGKFPEGKEYEAAKEKVKRSPYILHIDESISVDEHYISEHIDFFYRSLTDHSIAYTVYVACDVGKPLITHNIGSLPVIIQRENIGFVLNGKTVEESNIIHDIKNWKPDGNLKFLEKRTWQNGAERLMNNIHKAGV